MLQQLSKSRGQAAPRMAGAAGLALLFLLNVSWSLLPHRKPHPADMTLRATAVAQSSPPPKMTLRASAVYPIVRVSRKHPAVAQAKPQPAPPPKPTPLPKPAPAAIAQATPRPSPTPKPSPKPTPASVAQATPRPSPTPAPTHEPRRKHQSAGMTLRAAAVGPLLPAKPKHPEVAETDQEISMHAEDATPAPEPTPPPAEEIRRIGVVRVIGTKGTFLLIEARDNDLIASLPDGTELRCRGSADTGGAQTGLLRVSPERRAPFIVADIVSGTPQVGDGVYLPDAASPPK